MKLPTLKQKDFRIYITKNGDRTLTPAQKRKVKEEQKFKCCKCGKKTDPRLLEIHHKKGIAKHKNDNGVNIPVLSQGKKVIPQYDIRSNLEAICYKCHDETKKKKKIGVKKKDNFFGF
jgi:5-methylcytosine-specific restriction endonuclease McrA